MTRKVVGVSGDAARRLRTRSAILTLVPALVFWELQKHHGKIVYLGGGKLLASTSEEAIQKIKPKLWELYDWLVKCSRGALEAYWTTIEDADATSQSMRKLLSELNRAK